MIGAARGRFGVLLGALILVPGDDTYLHLFDAASGFVGADSMRRFLV